jgi:dTDP-4-amino-4,6-dideoxygalactose transaminase
MIPFHVPYRTGHEAELVAGVLSGESHGGNGPYTHEAQAALEHLTGAPRVLLTTSCTAALELAAMLAGLGPGDEVVVPSFTFTSTAAAFLRTGASVVFADVDPSTMMLDPESVQQSITSETRALCLMHYAGVAAELDALLAIADRHELRVIEDAAQAIGASWDGRQLGTFGNFGTFSFHATKNIHCGLGGALVINDPDDVPRAEHVWERGTNRSDFLRGAIDKYTWVEVGSSFYPSEMQAAFLVAQLRKLDENTRVRSAIWHKYHQGLSPAADGQTFKLQRVSERATTNGHAFFVRTQDEPTCESLRAHLRDLEIDARTHYVPLHTSPVGLRLGNKAGTLPNTERYAGTVLRLPLHHQLTDDDIGRVIEGVLGFYR